MEIIVHYIGGIMNQPIGYIVIPDIHGCYDELTQMLDLIDKRKLLNERKLVFLGDYINRGPKIPQTLDLCIQLKSEGHIFLMGNHEYQLVYTSSHMDNMTLTYNWLMGPEEGMLSQYANNKRLYFDEEDSPHFFQQLIKAIPKSHFEFMKSCDLYFETPELLCIHAGIDPDVSWEKQRDELDMITPTIDKMPRQLVKFDYAHDENNKIAPKILVTGHVAKKPDEHIRPNRIRLDSGCGEKRTRLNAWVSDTGELLTIHSTYSQTPRLLEGFLFIDNLSIRDRIEIFVHYIGGVMNQPIGYIVIPDVHGHYDTLVAMLELLEKRNLLSNRKLVFLGDYVDRGPKIPDTLSLCVELKKSGHIFLMGNHDYWLVEIFQQKMEGKKSLRWAYKYGVPILQQYFHFLSRRLPRNRDELYYDTCEKIRQIIPPQHREFIESCQMYFETETMLCIHAGINYEEDWEKQKQN